MTEDEKAETSALGFQNGLGGMTEEEKAEARKKRGALSAETRGEMSAARRGKKGEKRKKRAPYQKKRIELGDSTNLV